MPRFLFNSRYSTAWQAAYSRQCQMEEIRRGRPSIYDPSYSDTVAQMAQALDNTVGAHVGTNFEMYSQIIIHTGILDIIMS